MISDNQWRVISDLPRLDVAVVDLWRVDLDRDPATSHSFLQLLSIEERERAGRFVFEKDRGRFIVCRAALRTILGGSMHIAPGQIRISANRYGKPYLSDPEGGIRFNVSHSHGLAVIAVTLDREIGVDLEFVDRDFDISSIPSSLYTPSGLSRFRSLPPDLQVEEFFSAWTRKEAVLKATGDGLSSSEELQSAIRSINDDDLPCPMSLAVDNRSWTVTGIDVQSNFKAALAVEGPIDAIRHWRPAQFELSSVFRQGRLASSLAPSVY